MLRTLYVIASIFAIYLISAEAQTCQKHKFVVLRDTAKRREGLRPIFDRYTKALGGINNGNEAGPLKEGHRRIDWDADIVPFKMPGNFFVKTATRGARMIAKGGKFRVSNPVPPNGDHLFSTINRVASKDFSTFSPKRLFTPLIQNKVTVDFSVPGPVEKDALVKGFGAIYVDVDKRRVTSATYLDKKGCVLTKQFVDPRDKGLSFLGVLFKKPVIAKVILKLGDAPIVNKKGDFVVLDDFLYGEPQPLK